MQYELNGIGKAKAWFKASAVTAGYMALAALAILNVYYRGLVFIIAGPRRKKSETVSV